MGDLIYCEFLKLKRSKIQLIALLGALITPFLVTAIGIKNYYSHPENAISLFSLYDEAFMFFMLLFGPLVFTMLAAFLFSREYSEKTLKTIFAVSLSKKRFLISKFLVLFICIMTLFVVSWASIFILALLCSIFFKVSELDFFTSFFFLIKMVLGGILLYATITPFAYLAIRTKGVLVPFIAIAAVALLNVVLTNSTIAGFYPWTASYLLLNGRLARTGCPTWGAIGIIGFLFVLSVCASILHFQKEDIT